MSEVVIREVAEPDFDRIRQIAAAAWKNTYDWRRGVMDAEMYSTLYGDGHEEKGRRVEAQCRQWPDLTRVAELDGRVVGFVTWRLDSPAAGFGSISNNAVDPSAQGRGVGQAMYRWVLQWFRDHGMRYAAVSTAMDPGHARARAAYERAGFNVRLDSIQYFQKL